MQRMGLRVQSTPRDLGVGRVVPPARGGTMRRNPGRSLGGEVRYSMVRYGTVWYGTVRYGTVRYGNGLHNKTRSILPYRVHVPLRTA